MQLYKSAGSIDLKSHMMVLSINLMIKKCKISTMFSQGNLALEKSCGGTEILILPLYFIDISTY